MAEVDGAIKLGVDFDTKPAENSTKTLENTLKELGSVFTQAFQNAEKSQAKLSGSLDKLNDNLEKLYDSIAQIGKQTVEPKSVEDIVQSAENLDSVVEIVQEVEQSTVKADTKTQTLGQTLKEMSNIALKAFGDAEQAQIRSTIATQKANEAVKKQENAIEQLKSKYSSIAMAEITPPSLKKMESDIKAVTKEYEKLKEEWKKAKETVSNLEIGVETKELIAAKKRYEDLGEELGKVEAKLFDMQDVAQKFRLDPTATLEAKKLAGDIEVAEMKLKRLKDEEEAVKSSFMELSSGAKLTADAASLIPMALSKIPAILKGANNILGSFLKGVKKVGSGMTGVFTGATKAMASFFSKGRKDMRSFSLFSGNLFKRLQSIILSAFIFNVASRGLQQLQTYIGNVLATNSVWVRSMQEVKGNLLTAFQPIIEVVIPILNVFAQALSTVTGYLAAFVSLLFGKSISDSAKAASALNKEANAIGKTGKAADKSAKQLSRFQSGLDDLYVLQKEKDKGDSSGVLPPIFPTEIQLPDWLKNLGDLFKQGEFGEAGRVLAEKLNEVIDGVDWVNLGTNIGNALQKAFEFAKGFLNNLNLEDFGAGIATALNNIFRNLDPELVGETIAEFFNRIVDFVHGFVNALDWRFIGQWFASMVNAFTDYFDWQKAGRTVADTINGIVNLLYEFITKTNWARIGVGIGTAINESLTNINWTMMGATVAAGFNAVVDTLLNTVRQINWGDIGLQFSMGLNSIFTGIRWSNFGIAVAEIINGIGSLFLQYVTAFDWGNVGTSFASAINGFILNIDLGIFAVGIGALINGIIDLIYNFITQTNWSGLALKLTDGINKGINEIDFAKIGLTIGEAVKTLITLFANLIQNTDWQNLSIGFISGFRSIDWIGIVQSMAELLGSALGGLARMLFEVIKDTALQIGNYFSSEIEKAGGNVVEGLLRGLGNLGPNQLVAWIKDNIVIPILDGFKRAFGIASPARETKEIGVMVIEGLKIGIESLKDAVIQIFIDILSKIKENWQPVKAWFDEKVINPLKAAFQQFVQPVIDNFKSIWENVKGVWNTVKTWFDTNVINPVKQSFAGLTEPIKQAFQSAWNGAKQTWENAANWFRTGVVDPIKNVLNGIIDLFNNMLSGAENGINALVRAANSLNIEIPDWVPSIGGRSFGVNLNTISVPRIPRLAQGTVVQPNKEFLALLGDNRTEQEIVSPLSTIKQALKEAMQESGSGNNGNVTVQIIIDGRTLGEAVIRYINGQTQQTGVIPLII